MNKKKLWKFVIAIGLAVTSVLLVLLLPGLSTVRATFDGDGAIPNFQYQNVTFNASGITKYEVSGLISDVQVIESVDELFAGPGERRIYQIVMSPEQDIPRTRLTDTLPLAVTWADRLSATSGNVSYSNRILTWSGSLTPGVPVTITYDVIVPCGPYFGTVVTDIYTDVYNHAVIDDGHGNISDSTSAVFAIGRPFGTGSDRTFAVAFGDADKDGDLDLAVGNHGQNQICWNNGYGNFDCESAFEGNATFDVNWGDMNGDTYLDLVVANSSKQPNLVCLNNGDRTFQCSAFGVCSDPSNSSNSEVCHVALGDVDGDEDLDIALGTRYKGTIASLLAPDVIYYNKGDGTFEPITGTACQGHPTLDLAFGDIDNDTDLDLAVVGHYSEYVCINDGAGHFTQTRWLVYRLDENTSSVALGDIDQNGYLDVAVGRETHSNEVYLNDGPGNPGYFTNKLPFGPVWEKTWDVAWGDVDADDDLDLASGNTYRHTGVYFNEPMATTPGLTLTRPIFLGLDSHRTQSVDFGDVDDDGDLDLATGVNGGQNVIYLNTLVMRCVAHLPIILKNSVL
jgi:hypothetical protein